MLVDINSITILPDRQRRKNPDLTGLKSSIAKIGIINPITVDDNLVLIAGWCRLHAAKELGYTEVPINRLADLPADERELIEFEENVRREELPWKDQCAAVLRYIRLLKERLEVSDLSLTAIAQHLGWSYNTVVKYVEVGKELEFGNEKIAAAGGINAAHNLIKRVEDRKMESELAQLDLIDIFSETSLPETTTEEEVEVTFESISPEPARPVIQSANQFGADSAVKQLSLLDQLPKHNGLKYNFIHCDFPYGVNMQDSEQASSATKTTYNDTPELYFSLLRCFLEHRDRFMLPACHILFWFSMDFYVETCGLIEQYPDLSVCRRPLIWHKSDLRGIVPDAARQPRWTYETALLIARGDRKIISPVAASFSHPTARPAQHISQKPQPVLEHFFKMLVDRSSIVLDPTCGSGTALCAADKLGARSVTGWDIEPEFVTIARDNLRRQRVLAKTGEENAADVAS